MNKLYLLALSFIVLTISSCSPKVSNAVDMVGGDKDDHGCIKSAGYTWSLIKKACIRPFSFADIKLDDPEDKNLSVYVVLSKNKSQAEIFSANLPANTILDKNNNGNSYTSKDGKIQLLKIKKNWQLRKE